MGRERGKRGRCREKVRGRESKREKKRGKEWENKRYRESIMYWKRKSERD